MDAGLQTSDSSGQPAREPIERRLAALRDLGVRLRDARTAEQVCTIDGQTLALHSADIPFSLLYLIAPDRKQAYLAAAAGVATGGAISPHVIALEGDGTGSSWPLREVVQPDVLQIETGPDSRLTNQMVSGPWSDGSPKAVVLPIRSHPARDLAGFLVAGISSRLPFEQPDRDFLELVSAQISAAFGNVREFGGEQTGAEVLAEIEHRQQMED